MTLACLSWTNPARDGRLSAVLCQAHARSLVHTLRTLRIGVIGSAWYDNGQGCDQCRGRQQTTPQ